MFVLGGSGDISGACLKVLEKLKNFPDKIGASIEKYHFREALVELMNLARLGNKYLADSEPWKLKKINEKRTETILNIAMQIVASLAIHSEQFMPFTSDKLKKILVINNTLWNDATGKIISDHHNIKPTYHLFNKIEDEKIEEQLQKLQH